MPFTPITFGNKNPLVPRVNFFNWPVTFNDSVTFRGDITLAAGKSVATAGTFTALTRGITLSPAYPTTTTWIDFGSSMNLGIPADDSDVWVTAAATADVLSDVGSSVYRMRVGISKDGGSSYTYGPEVWGTADSVSRRQSIAASFFRDCGAITTGARVKVQVMRSSGGDPTFAQGSVNATMAQTLGVT